MRVKRSRLALLGVKRCLFFVLAALVAAAGMARSGSAQPTAVDLGTLGGSSSSTASGAGVNASGQVIGTSTIEGDTETHAFVWTAADGMVDLGTLPGHAHSYPTAINAGGQVVGASMTADFAITRAFFWSQSTGMIDLGTLPGDDNSTAVGINVSGQVIGTSSCSSCGTGRGFIWTQSGGMVDLGSLGGDITPISINASGQVVGTNTGAGGSRVFSWTAATGMVDVGDLGAGFTLMETDYGPMVNDSGQVTGYSVVPYGENDGTPQAFVWSADGGMIDVDGRPASTGLSSDPFAIGPTGMVVGTMCLNPDCAIAQSAFAWTPATGMLDLGSLGAGGSGAVQVNGQEQVIGTFGDADGVSHAFMWTAAGGMIELQGLGGATYVWAMTDNGIAVGQSDGDQGTRAVLWHLPSGSNNTAEGTDVVVSPAPGIMLTFSTVASSGNTTVTSSGATPPASQFSVDGQVYDMSTTATFSGAITVCLPYSSGADPATLSLFHYENGVWRDVTTTRNSANQSICGSVISLSPFAVARPIYSFTGFFSPVQNLPTLNGLKSGSAGPMKFSLGGDRGLNIMMPGYPRSQTIACDPNVLVLGLDETVAAGNSGLSYDAATQQYVYVWKTDKSWANTCRQFVIILSCGTVQRADFKFAK